MASIGKRCVFVILVSTLVLCTSAEEDHFTRKLTTEFKCRDNGVNLAYTRAEGVNDTLHYLISSKGVPTVFIAETGLHASLMVNCSRFANGSSNSIQFNETSSFAFALMFPVVYEYNDVQDTADMKTYTSDQSQWKVHPLSNATWSSSVNISDTAHHKIVLQAHEVGDLTFNSNGSLRFVFQIYNSTGRNAISPRLQYTANNTQFDFSMENATTSTNFSSSRFAFQMMMVSMDPISQVHLSTQRSISDEFSPGVFELIDWTDTPLHSSETGYTQWKPVCYTKADRSLSSVSRATTYPMNSVNMTRQKPQASIAYAFFGNKMYEGKHSVTATNISFGLSKDKFYVGSNYTVWTATVGYGTPPEDKISTMIIIIITVGLGLPAVLIIFGSIGVCIKRYRNNRYGSYQPIN